VGIYNPYAPEILGQEWVPIREEDLALPPGSPVQAFGQRFLLTSAQSLNELRWYTRDYPRDTNYTNVVAEVYPTNLESFTGPIKRVLIPASSGTVTGSDVSFDTSMQASLLNPSDSLEVTVNMENTYATNPAFTVYFAGSTYATALAGKRILAINVLYTMHSFFDLEQMERNGAGNGGILMSLSSNIDDFFLAFSDWDQVNNNSLPFDINPVLGVAPPDTYRRVSLGTGNYFYTSGSSSDNEQAPWVPADLARFEASAASRLGITVDYSPPGNPTFAFTVPSQWTYMALEVFYCEENRVAVGLASTNSTTTGTVNSVNRITLRHPVTKAATPSVGPGAFTALVYPADVPPMPNLPSPSQEVESLRQLYQIPSLAGVSVRMPYPYDESVVGQVFESEPSDILPHLTLHTTTAVVTDTHPYGRQARAEVYGSITATQEVLDSVAGVATSYPQVRFYARRFGETSTPLTLSSAAFANSTASITPNEFDALEEIVDGWKEVTLRFATAPSMGTGTSPQWSWSSTGEIAGNRWEILGAAAPALSGIPGNLFNLATQQLSAATYGMPISGSTVNLGWVPGISPLVTVTTDDQTADAALLFSTDPVTPSGLGVSPVSQALAMADPQCSIDPSCVPSSLFYNALAWSPISGASLDSFNRIAASGWGATELNQAWTVSGVTANYSVNGSYGVHAHPASTATVMLSTMDAGSSNVEAYVEFTADTLDTAGTLTAELQVRRTDSNNYYRVMASISSAQVMTILLGKVVAGSSTTLETYTLTPVHSATGVYKMKMRASGTYLFAKIWEDSQSEPPTWQVWASDTSLSTGTLVGVGSTDLSAAGVAVNFLFNNFYVQPSSFGALEVQRYDPVDTVFSTIMLATNAAVTGFNDYEARVGQPSVYRIRQRNVYDFAGLWSTPVTGTVASPGVVGADTALTLFTSNARQDGSINLAYSAAWDSNPVEDFSWAEADMVTYQNMYLKNYPTSFHPLERGGEAFGRTILVNAAGIPEVASQNGFKYLRDMAWESVPYICVRDELGNRWYASVTVPQGRRRRMVTAGHLDTAQVQIVEVTDTPYPVDP